MFELGGESFAPCHSWRHDKFLCVCTHPRRHTQASLGPIKVWLLQSKLINLCAFFVSVRIQFDQQMTFIFDVFVHIKLEKNGLLNYTKINLCHLLNKFFENILQIVIDFCLC